MVTEQTTSDGGGESPSEGPPPRRRRVLWVWLAVALAVLTAVGGAGAWANAHVTRTCLRCHSPGSIHLTEHSHRSLQCVGCHDAKLGRVAGQYAVSWLPGQHKIAQHAPPDRRRCQQCHSSTVRSLRAITETRGHVVHVMGKPKLECPECHGGSLHSTRPNLGSCARCHADVKVFHPESSRIPCTSCHDFLASTLGPTPDPSTDCRRCHSSGAARQAPGQGQRGRVTLAAGPIGRDLVHGNVAECGLCHHLHRRGAPKSGAGDDCARCHAKVVKLRAEEADTHHARCSSCHAPHDRRAALKQELCDRCHQPPPQAKEHGVLAYRHGRCGTCHVAHRLRTQTVACTNCHKAERDRLATWPSKTHSNCSLCHVPHKDVSPAAGCAGCHAEHADHAHVVCTACHDPHGGRVGVKACSSCHRGAEVAALAGSPHGGNCTSCHATHQVAGANLRCGRCHGKQAGSVATAQVARHRNCDSCHAPHRFGAAPTLCLSCHQDVTGGPHGNDCRRCHASHGKATADPNACSSCHGDVPKIQGAHQRCTSCHAAHKPAAQARCEHCHAGQVAGVRAWPRAEHQTCASCHIPHQPASPKPCAGCHGGESARFGSSRHGRCTSCHQVHQAPVAWWGQCNKCHAAEAASARSARSAAHTQCKNCHQPHQGLEKTCRSCHQAIPGSHAQRGHERCADCHGQHRTDVPGRATCLKCHEKQANHYPDAARCWVCHLFQ